MGTEVYVVSFNIRLPADRDGDNHWDNRRDTVAGLLHTSACDLVGLQEVFTIQRDFLESALPAFEFLGVSRADGGIYGEQNPVGVRSTRFRIESWQTRWLSGQPDEIGSIGWDARIPRVATIVRLTDRASGAQIGMINTHFDHQGPTARLESARQIGQWVRAEPQRAWLLTGDLNAQPAEEPLAALAAAGLRDVLGDYAGGTFHAWSGSRTRRRIDYVLADEHWELIEAHVDYQRPGGVLPSDHWPVCARLRLADG